MPLYDIEHTTTLSPPQQQRLATAFTDLHSRRFRTPRVFLNVRFTDASAQPVYRGGRLAVYNRVVLRTRASDQRSKEDYDDHCRDLIRAWREVLGIAVGEGMGGEKGEGEGEGEGEGGGKGNEKGVGVVREEDRERDLRTVWVVPALLTAVECGVARPRVGEEAAWLVQNRAEFERLAEGGDEDFVELLREIDGERA
ncbi:hypothetical protein F5B20DRAFT_104423 [Whalleya microplaca]|nr:hypothetical protein F5B20DRAFT_104423 [Whalleya microplaca]